MILKWSQVLEQTLRITRRYRLPRHFSISFYHDELILGEDLRRSTDPGERVSMPWTKSPRVNSPHNGPERECKALMIPLPPEGENSRSYTPWPVPCDYPHLDPLFIKDPVLSKRYFNIERFSISHRYSYFGHLAFLYLRITKKLSDTPCPWTNEYYYLTIFIQG